MRLVVLKSFLIGMAITAGFLLLGLTFSQNVNASTCDMLAYPVDDARAKLKQAATETDFEFAKDYARRAQRALHDAAMVATHCKCDIASGEFDSAAVHARRAYNANNPEEFADSLSRSNRSYNSALQALRTCSGTR